MVRGFAYKMGETSFHFKVLRSCKSCGAVDKEKEYKKLTIDQPAQNSTLTMLSTVRVLVFQAISLSLHNTAHMGSPPR